MPDIAASILRLETPVRLGFFVGVFAVMAAWELLAPRRSLSVSRTARWSGNLAMVCLNTLLLRVLFPATAVGLALLVDERGYGVLGLLEMPCWVEVVVAVVVLDLAIYLQHVLFHAVPALWRLHRVHHADLDFDVTTGARFHCLEIVLSMVLKFAVILALGPAALAVLMFEVALSATALFNHGNVRLGRTLDRAIRLVVVTPDMHRVHHSVDEDETNSNFGFNLSWWDRLLGTYRDQPRKGHERMTIGILDARGPVRCVRLRDQLVLPFVGPAGNYPINRRSWREGEER